MVRGRAVRAIGIDQAVDGKVIDQGGSVTTAVAQVDAAAKNGRPVMFVFYATRGWRPDPPAAVDPNDYSDARALISR